MYVGPGSEKKRDEKAAVKMQEQMDKESIRSEASRISNKSFGNALKGTPGNTFEVAGLKFTVLNKFDVSGTRRIV